MSQIKPNECRYIWTSLSGFCVQNLTDFRNEPMKKAVMGGEGKPIRSCCSNWMRRIVAEPIYLAVGVVAVVEAVVRLPLAMIAGLVKLAMCCDFQTKRTNSCLDTMFFGSVACIETAIFSFEALVYNICSRVVRSDKFYIHPAPLETK